MAMSLKPYFSNNVLKVWTPLVILITALSALVYLAIQQNYRMSANDPQIQIAQDVAVELANGQNPQFFVPTRKLNLNKSLGTYIMIFDEKGKLISSSVNLDGKDPTVPKGMFDTTKKQGETRFTWQPKEGIRSALVVDYYSGKASGFVAVGRSLKEVEKRIDNLGTVVFAGWLVTLGASLAFVYLLKKSKLK